jgi:hypothetical protein
MVRKSGAQAAFRFRSLRRRCARLRIAAVTRRTLAVLVVLASVSTVGCGGNGTQGRRVAPAMTPRATPDIVGRTGRLVGIGAGRRLFLACTGSGRPTVVLEAGLGGNAFDWQNVQPELGRTTRTCAYDRAGTGISPAIPGVHDARDEIDDLGRLLDHAHVALHTCS